MATRISTNSRNAAADAIAALANGGTIEIYSGSQPATANTAPSGTLLVTVPLASTAFDVAVNGVASLKNAPLSGTGTAAGTAGWFRVKGSGGAAVFDGSAGTSGTDLVLNTATVSVGLTVLISGSLTMPTG